MPEHFDGLPTLSTLAAVPASRRSPQGGVDCIILCGHQRGTLFADVSLPSRQAIETVPNTWITGMRAHNDRELRRRQQPSGRLEAGATHVQGHH